MQWYVAEQIEEEALARHILDKLKLIGDDKGGLYLFDRDIVNMNQQKTKLFYLCQKSILNKKSLSFLENYINNPSPTGFESGGQKMWLDYIKPYIDTHIVDTYGTVVGVINPEKNTKL